MTVPCVKSKLTTVPNIVIIVDLGRLQYLKMKLVVAIALH